MALHIDSSNFKSEVLESGVPVLVDFFADWCGPCKMVAPIVEELSKEFAGKAKVLKVNVDEASELAQAYNIMSIPTFMIFKSGKSVETFMGALSKNDLSAKLAAHL